MQYSQSSFNNSVSTRSNYSYINDLINTAISQGLYFVYTDGRHMDDDMANDLMVDYGFRVDKRFDDIGLYPTYLISWNNALISYNYGVFTYDFQGETEFFVVPQGVTSIGVVAYGAQGGGPKGGYGAGINTTLAVTPGQWLYITVGGQPGDNNAVYGGGGAGGVGPGGFGFAGGGYTGIFTDPSFSQGNALIIAAGGGGTDGYTSSNGGSNGGTPNSSAGGYGGGYSGTPGGGANQSGGGTAGTPYDSNSVNPTAGSALQGGNGGSVTTAGWHGGGGAGGGFFGGGGGAGGGAATGAGSGGSSYVNGTYCSNTSYSATNITNGGLTITANQP